MPSSFCFINIRYTIDSVLCNHVIAYLLFVYYLHNAYLLFDMTIPILQMPWLVWHISLLHAAPKGRAGASCQQRRRTFEDGFVLALPNDQGNQES